MANPTVILIPLCFGLQLGMSQVALAQEVYPSRAITIINPFPPGGTSEIVTRPLAAALEPIVKQPVVSRQKRAPPVPSALSSSPPLRPTAIRSCPTSHLFPALPRSTSSSGESQSSPAPTSFPLRVSPRIR